MPRSRSKNSEPSRPKPPERRAAAERDQSMDRNRAVSSPAAPIHLLIIDEHPVVGEGIRTTVGAEPDIRSATGLFLTAAD
jgi:hypothetical protein